MGPDRLHPRVLKETARIVAPILQIIFSKSLENGEDPDDWKQANIAPIFKKGERYCPSNYRPVLLTCVCSKLMEHIISKHLLNHLEANNILFDKQHGFRKKRSTDTQLLAFTQVILANLSDGRQTDVIIIDFAKVFDKVPHHRLIQKLERYGITGPVNTWIETFFKDRKQHVACEGIYSDWAPVISGAPQGSVIAPILFLIYINDLPNNLKLTVQLFADDTIIYMTISNGIDGTALQQDLDKLAKW